MLWKIHRKELCVQWELLWKAMWQYPSKLEGHILKVIPLLGIYPRENLTHVPKETWARMINLTLLIIAKELEQPSSPQKRNQLTTCNLFIQRSSRQKEIMN